MAYKRVGHKHQHRREALSLRPTITLSETEQRQLLASREGAEMVDAEDASGLIKAENLSRRELPWEPKRTKFRQNFEFIETQNAEDLRVKGDSNEADVSSLRPTEIALGRWHRKPDFTVVNQGVPDPSSSGNELVYRFGSCGTRAIADALKCSGRGRCVTADGFLPETPTSLREDRENAFIEEVSTASKGKWSIEDGSEVIVGDSSNPFVPLQVCDCVPEFAGLECRVRRKRRDVAWLLSVTFGWIGKQFYSRENYSGYYFVLTSVLK